MDTICLGRSRAVSLNNPFLSFFKGASFGYIISNECEDVDVGRGVMYVEVRVWVQCV